MGVWEMENGCLFFEEYKILILKFKNMHNLFIIESF